MRRTIFDADHESFRSTLRSVNRIYGGTSEVMKLIIAKSMGL